MRNAIRAQERKNENSSIYLPRHCRVQHAGTMEPYTPPARQPWRAREMVRRSRGPQGNTTRPMLARPQPSLAYARLIAGEHT